MPEQASSVEQVAVVGAGMLGLSVALQLQTAGRQVTVFDSAPEIGGLAGAWQVGDITWDKFYHVISLSDESLRALLAKIGLDSEIRWVTTRTGFYTDGKLHSLSTSLDFLRFKPLSLWQKFRLGGTIFYASKKKPSKRLETITVERWLTKLSGKSTFEKIWKPLLQAKLGEAYKQTSAMFIWSYIDRMYKARRSGMKREMFGYVPGGYARILAALKTHLQSLGVQFRLGQPVTQVLHLPDQDKLAVQVGQSHDHHGQSAFDRVVMTVANPLIASSCVQLTQQEREQLLQAKYLGVLCTSLLLDRPLGGYYVTNITDSWVPLTGIIETGSIVPPEQMGGHYLIYLPQYLDSNDPRLESDSEQIHERCLTTLEKMYSRFSRDQVRAIQTARARYVMTVPTLNYSQQVPTVKSSIPGLYLLNSAQITFGCLNVNEIIQLANRCISEHLLSDDH